MRINVLLPFQFSVVGAVMVCELQPEKSVQIFIKKGFIFIAKETFTFQIKGIQLNVGLIIHIRACDFQHYFCPTSVK